MDVLSQVISLKSSSAIITTLLCALLLILGCSWLLAEDVAAIPFVVDLPPQLRDGYQSDLTSTTGEPEVRNGKIYPRCPADGRPLTTEPIIPATRADVDTAVRRASEAQKTWAKTTFAQRKKLLNTLLKYILDNQEAIVTAACLDSGKTKIDASFGEILVTVEKLQWTIKHGERALVPSARPTNLLMCYKKNYVVYEPLGVVASSFSWNYPFHSWISTVISALFAGNAIVNKPSEQTCWSSFYFLDIVRTALNTLGHSPDLVQNVICLPDVADYLTSHTGISHLTFIGSRPVAHKVCASAAKSLTPVTVELGGKDPAILLDDSASLQSVDSVSALLLRGTFQSAGQNCIGIERIIALPNMHDVLVSKLEEKVRQIRLGSITLARQGDPDIDMGSMISPASFDRLEALVASAVSAGATLHAGGTRYHHPKHPHGYYFAPTLLSKVLPDMEIAQIELFAPVCTVMRANSVDHAIELANATSYSLGASVFGAPTTKNWPILQRIAREVKSGMVSINDFGAFYVCSLPFGGVRGSGYGRFGGEEGLRDFEEEDGVLVCTSCGRQQEGLQIAEQDDADYGTQGKISRKKIEKTKAKVTKVYRGAQAYRLYLQAWQHIMWKQAYALIHGSAKAPASLWTVAKDLWALRLSSITTRLVTTADVPPSVEEGEQNLIDSDSEPQNTKSVLGTHLVPRLWDAIALLYLAALLVRCPLTLQQLYERIRTEEIPFIRAIRHVPLDILNKLPPEYHEALDTATVPTSHELHEAVYRTLQTYTKEFGMTLPALNWRIILFDWIQHLALPIEVYPAVRQIAGLIGYSFAYELPQQEEDDTRDGKTQRTRRSPVAMAEVQLASLLLVATKMLFPFDTESPGNASLRLDWTAWLRIQKPSAPEHHAQSKPSIESGKHIELHDRDINNMTAEQLDDYMDWYQRTFTIPEKVLQAKKTDLEKSILDMFPLSETPQIRLPKSRDEINKEDQESNLAAKVTAEAILPANTEHPQHTNDQPEDDGNDNSLPGSQYPIYSTVEALQATSSASKESNEEDNPVLYLHNRVAELCCTDLKRLLRGIRHTEKRIEKWQAEKKRQEVFDMAADVEEMDMGD
ncbi:Meiotic Sister-Chromatid recombination aldehyde dehydrogenase [Lithohypha guttulata]|uniref:aldehyde dehydrogenase (NAD(+)) n=1 Tax=Lithohypha guttulata TaxID=1690604 RepID=A0AAN7T2Z5_9EURO|nr:Meiotic Sister-Chromatid recombination aldehyde dehydrogenase [Lithohypha guttulata]